MLLFLVIAVVISLFLPSGFQLERSTVINADKKQIFNQVNDLRRWENWAPWALKDPSIYLDESNYSNPAIGEGAYFKWNSKNDEVGKGKLTITKIKKNQSIEYEVDFGMGKIPSGFYLEEVEGGIEVTWSMKAEFGFNPLAKFFGLFMEDYVAEDYDLGLKRLKSHAEKLPRINSVKVEKTVIDQQWFLSIRDTVNQMEMNNVHGKMFAQINQYMNENEIEVADVPVVIYHFWSDSIIDIEAGIPVLDSIEVNHSLIKLNKLAKGNVVTAVHYGPYERLVETYNGINEWMRKNEVVVIGPPWEKYITDPSTEPNPEKWQTAIYFPIQ